MTFLESSSVLQGKCKPVLTSFRYPNRRLSVKPKTKSKNSTTGGSKLYSIDFQEGPVKIEELQATNSSLIQVGDEGTRNYLNEEISEAIAKPEVNTMFYKVIQLSLFGNSSKINSNFKIFKDQPSLQSLCSLVPNQPAPKKDKRFEQFFGGSANKGSSYTVADPYEPANICYALESIFENRPSTLFFQYLPQWGRVRDILRAKKCNKNTLLKYKHTHNSIQYNCVANVLSKAGMVMTDDEDWSLLLSTPLLPIEDLK